MRMWHYIGKQSIIYLTKKDWTSHTTLSEVQFILEKNIHSSDFNSKFKRTATALDGFPMNWFTEFLIFVSD